MFTKSSNNKVKFQDQQLDDYLLEVVNLNEYTFDGVLQTIKLNHFYYETNIKMGRKISFFIYFNCNSVLKSKLQSKIDALSIMNSELDKCSMERDRYKLLVEQLKFKQTPAYDHEGGMYRFMPTNNISGGDMLAKTRDQNNMLKLEVENLRSKLDEATGDIIALRKQIQKKDSVEDLNGSSKVSMVSSSGNDYEQLVQDLEKVQKKYQQIQLDYRATLDEKEELVSDRDYYKSKVQRLNHQISYVLSSRVKNQQDNDVNPPKPIVDIDALVTENKYLHERITQLEVEKEIVKRTLTKYKTLLDNRNKNDSFTLKKGFADVMTQKQVREFLDINSKTGLKRTSAAELKSLCLGLLEALNDKSIALQHQRKTNQILANRITELEKTLESWCNGQKYIPIFPSQMLLEEFLPDLGSARSDESKEKAYDKSKYSDSDEDKDISDGSSDVRSNENESIFDDKRMSKTVLPLELEQLVKEALAELKPMG